MEKQDRDRLPRVLVVAADTLFSEGICAIINNSGSCDIVGNSTQADEAIEKTRQLQPDVLLIDMVLPGRDVETMMHIIHEEMKNVRVLLIGNDSYKDPIFRGLIAGARGYVSRTESSPALVSAVLDVFHGESFLSPSVTKLLVSEYCKVRIDGREDPYYHLSAREKEVLRYIAEGNTSKAIGEKLNISVKTVMGHRSRLMKRLDVHGTTELVKYAIKKHLVELDTS